MPKIVLISGKAGSGKDTFAKYLQIAYTCNGQRVKITHFGDLLKYICREFFGWDGNKSDYGRGILQFVGTEVIRQCDKDYFVKFLDGIVTMFGENWDVIIIADARFQNEVEFFRSKYNADFLRVVRDNPANSDSVEHKNHSSETELDHFGPVKIIDNNGTQQALMDQAIIYADSNKRI